MSGQPTAPLPRTPSPFRVHKLFDVGVEGISAESAILLDPSLFLPGEERLERLCSGMLLKHWCSDLRTKGSSRALRDHLGRHRVFRQETFGGILDLTCPSLAPESWHFFRQIERGIMLGHCDIHLGMMHSDCRAIGDDREKRLSVEDPVRFFGGKLGRAKSTLDYGVRELKNRNAGNHAILAGLATLKFALVAVVPGYTLEFVF